MTNKLTLLASVLLATASTLFAQPVIQSFTPLSGPIGTTVTITGTGFSTTATSNIVYFGAVKTTVSAATATTLTVAVPAGATFQPITVTYDGKTASSAVPFIVTYTNSNAIFTPASFAPKKNFVTGIYPHSVAAGDFDGDGKTDLVVSKGSSATLSVLKNNSANGTISFVPQTDLTGTANSHEGSATADLDGDGKLDIIIANANQSATVSVFRNTSNGSTISFAAKIDYPAAGAPYNVATGDLNGDGKPDLVIANNGADVISIYKNTSIPGTLSFDAKLDITTGTVPFAVAVGDLDGDGKADIAATNQGSSSSVSVLRNTGTGDALSFAAYQNVDGLAAPFTISIADIDGDGKPELAAAAAGLNGIAVFKNFSLPGTIAFAPGQSFTTGSYPTSVAVADMDGDGKPDLVSANRFSNDVSVLKNTSTVSLLSFATTVNYAVNEAPIHVAVADLDNDGVQDIIASNSSENVISVLRNIAVAGIAPVIGSFTPVSGLNGTSVTITGVNFTGATAVTFGGLPAASFTINSSTTITAIVGSGASGEVAVTTENGTAILAGFTYTGPIIQSFTPVIATEGALVTINGANFSGATNVRFGGVEATSFTVDLPGKISAIVGNGASGNVTVITPNGVATSSGFVFNLLSITSITPNSGATGSQVIIAGSNFNTTAASNTVFFGAVKATVTSATSTELKVTVPAGATHGPVTVTTNNLTAYSSQSFLPTFPGDGSGITTSSFAAVGNFGTGAYPGNILFADINNDGKADIITANNLSNGISILKNTSTPGSFTFNVKTDFPTGPDAKRIATGDLDGDGKLDIAVVNFNAGNASTVSVFLNNSSAGTIALSAKTDYPTGNGSLSVAIADITGDGKPDMVVTSGNSGFISVFRNTTAAPGTITFATKVDFSFLFHGDHVTLADLNGDRKPEIIVANFSGTSVSVAKNTSVGGILSFDPKIDFPVGSNPTSVIAGDLNKDGKMDLAVVNYSSGSISLLRNNGTGNAISFEPTETYPVSNPGNLSIADIDGDGKPDLALGRGGVAGIASAVRNTSAATGNFSFANPVDFTTGSFDTFIAAGDLDGDGKPELAVANTTLNNVTILGNKINNPEIVSLSAVTATAGTAVTITGTHFDEATAVEFGGTPAASFALRSATQIDATIGGGASGNITVITPHGVGSVPGFTFIPAVTAGGSTSFCKDGSVTLTSSANANNQWYKDNVIISGATAKTYIATASGNYTVKTTSNGITTTSPAGIAVTVTAIPKPTITKDASNNLVSSAANGNQWYLETTAIVGATSQTFHPTENGNYKVKVILDDCTSDLSDTYVVLFNATIDLGNDQFIKLSPNPVPDKLWIRWKINGVSKLHAFVTDLQGRRVIMDRSTGNGDALDLSHLSPGTYFIQVYNKERKISYTIKVVKI